MFLPEWKSRTSNKNSSNIRANPIYTSNHKETPIKKIEGFHFIKHNHRLVFRNWTGIQSRTHAADILTMLLGKTCLLFTSLLQMAIRQYQFYSMQMIVIKIKGVYGCIK